ncbi:metallophosphoesterase [Marinomonas sp.]|uniref:metallophosphoesterase family protein n=1 Tax=Marinomonas sp. TaxID=1904862 RepID=UPI003BACDAE4
MTKLNILHLSDIHFGHPDIDNEQDRLISGITKALNENEIKTDLIIFTGDLTQRALPSEFQNGEDWLRTIQSITGGKILVCPGNHDMDRTEANTETLRLAYSSEESFQLSKSKIYKNHSHIKPFMDWHQNASERDDNFISMWKDQIFTTSSKISIKNIDIHIVALNTAALSCGNDDEGKLCVDVAALNSALKGADSNKEFVISIGHHPINGWLPNWNSEKISTILEQENGPHIYMHGHVHNHQTLGSYQSSGSGLCYFTSGAAYQGSKWPQSFSVLTVDFLKREIINDIFSYHSTSGRWDHDPSSSRPIPIRLPDIKKEKEKTIIQSPQEKNIRRWDNPFDNVASNSLSPDIIPELFVDENNSINRISKSFDSMIEGQRGTGKTMLLRYLSIEVQSYIVEKNNLNVLESFREKKII